MDRSVNNSAYWNMYDIPQLSNNQLQTLEQVVFMLDKLRIVTYSVSIIKDRFYVEG